MNVLAVVEKHEDELAAAHKAMNAVDIKLRDELGTMLGVDIEEWDFEVLVELLNILPDCPLKSELLEYYDCI